MVDYNVNVTVLKDHSLAGISSALKNMYGAIHNPNKYHDNNCSPFCAHVFNLEPIRTKTRLNVIDAYRVQYQGGPGYRSNYIDYYGGILLSTDPVAVDAIGMEIVENFRKKHGMQSLAEDGRPVRYLEPAQEIGLGVADREKIDLVVRTVSPDGAESGGELWP
jgi:uncharacterized protein (DUF362 family)